ncbi:MAG TPA: glycosyltransferase family 4 protein [Anaerolineales bacterium]|nr:glycosyltransferase family 4 protein [Anaerolineales bacterium]
MNIVAIAGATIPSDTANSLQTMKACQALVQLGHDLTLLVPANQESSIVNRQSSIVKLRSHYGLQTDFPIKWLPSSSRRMFTWNAVRHARLRKADLIYSWFPQSAVFGLLGGLPVVFEIHIQPTGFFGPAWHRAFAILPGRKRLASITRALVEMLERDFHMRFPAKDIVIAPNGVELERFTALPDPAAARRQTGLRETPTVMCTGHLYAGRGADLFLALAKSFPQVHFVWVGGRPDDIAAWKQRTQLDNVTFTGFIPNRDLPLYQAAADVLLMPYARSIMGSSGTADSASVASPMKMFEYMATGRAILSADLPVIHEVLNDRNAVFCEPDDLSSWKSALETLLADPGKRLALGTQANRDVQGYTWLSRAERILNGFV